MGLRISMSCIPFIRQSLGGKYHQCLKRVTGMKKVSIIVFYALGNNGE